MDRTQHAVMCTHRTRCYALTYAAATAAAIALNSKIKRVVSKDIMDDDNGLSVHANSTCFTLKIIKMKNNHSNIDDLIQGIEIILSENRHSFTESQAMLLKEVIELLRERKRENLPKKHIDKAITLQALNLVARFFVEDFDHIKHALDELKRLLGL